MQKIKILILTLFLLSSSHSLLADSPITSIEIWKAYQDEPIIIEASKCNGILNESLFEYLIDARNPIAKKMALINRLSWDTEGKVNSQKFIKYLIDRKIYTSKEEFLLKGKGDELLSYAYLMAMDNYFAVTEATVIAEKALAKNQQSYTYQIINAIIKAQTALDGKWDKVFGYTDQVRRNKELNVDMSQKAISLIFDYMDIYKKYSVKK